MRLLVADANKDPFADVRAAYLPAMDIHDEITGLLRVAVDQHKRDPAEYDRWIETYVERLPLEIRQQLRWETAEETMVLARLAGILAR